MQATHQSLNLARLLPLLAALLWANFSCSASSSGAVGPVAPAAKQTSQQGPIDPGHYRWLEDIHSAQTTQWVQRENDKALAFLRKAALTPKWREKLAQTALMDEVSIPRAYGGLYYFTHRKPPDGGRQLVAARGFGETPVWTFPLEGLGPEGHDSVVALSFSPDGRKLAYALSQSGTDWQHWRVYDLAARLQMADALEQSRFSDIAWHPDSLGFDYVHYPKVEPSSPGGRDYGQPAVYRHRLGHAEAQDVCVFAHPDPEYMPQVSSKSHDGTLVIEATRGNDKRNEVYVGSTIGNGGAIKQLTRGLTGRYAFLRAYQHHLYFFTNAEAPKGRLVAFRSDDLDGPASEVWRPGDEDILRGAHFADGHWLLELSRRGESRLAVIDALGKGYHELDLPAGGTVDNLRCEPQKPQCYVSFSTMVAPPIIYGLNPHQGQLVALWRHRDGGAPQRPALVAQTLEATSADGTRLPVFMAHRADLARNGKNKTILYGYGGFGLPVQPQYGSNHIAWVREGGLYVKAVTRGGGEMGRSWHEAGMGLNKQHTFDDFAAVIRFLIDNKYTDADHLVLEGHSNGGLLMGAMITQHPDLFKAALCDAGVLDMERFAAFTSGAIQRSEYGDERMPAVYEYLLRYSPLHQVRKGTRYPAAWITTGMDDDRVYPAHSFKFAHALMDAQSGPAPIFLRVFPSQGHGGGQNEVDQRQQTAERFSFADAMTSD